MRAIETTNLMVGLGISDDCLSNARYFVEPLKFPLELDQV